MKRLILILAILWGVIASATGFYPLVFERGDTLVSATEDTTEGCFIYPAANTTRPIRPTVHIDFTEIGTNTTHYWWEIYVDVARTDLTKSASGWSEIGKVIIKDWTGLGAGIQNDKVIALPFLEPYACQYFRLRILAPVGVAADSTGYALAYNADQSGNMYTPVPTHYRIITHREIWGQIGAMLIIGGASTISNSFDLTIETTPGVFRRADRGVFTLFGSGGDNKVDDDTLRVIFNGKVFNTTGVAFLDTLLMPVSASTGSNGVFSFAFEGGGSGISDAAYMIFQPENTDGEDSSYVFTNIYLEVDQ